MKQALIAVGLVGMVATLGAGYVNAMQGTSKPSITVTRIPPVSLQSSPDRSDKIAGKVSGVNVKECKVVIFAFGDKWYVQPSETSPYTDIKEDGTWETDTHGGYHYAALLVKSSSYKPPAATETLPNVGGDVLATDTIPSITITRVPPASLQPGPTGMDAIAGKVRAVNVKECKVVIFAFGDKWYVQPYVAAPYTDLREDGTWETDTHGGFEYAALLVKSSYKPPATIGALPRVGGDVLAVAKAKPKK